MKVEQTLRELFRVARRIEAADEPEKHDVRIIVTLALSLEEYLTKGGKIDGYQDASSASGGNQKGS